MKTAQEQQKAAAEFAAKWTGRGDEKQETARFWIDLLQNVLGVENPTDYIEFEKDVQLSHTSFIDAYIAETKVLIEQKGAKINLRKAYKQSDGAVLTPFWQAKRYVSEMKASEKPRWIVVCNFREFWVYDLEVPNSEPQKIMLSELERDYYRLGFLVDKKSEKIIFEEEISKKAGDLVGKLYDALYEQYIPSENAAYLATDTNKRGLSAFQLKSLNILCVRIVFCLYAEKSGLFTSHSAFEDYIQSFAAENVREGIILLFKALDTKEGARDKYNTKLKAFPYVNGGLFRDENIEIPLFTDKIISVITENCAAFHWEDISPTIFGAVFESTLNPETRRKGGMHYTSIENIHKVIAPLFLDALSAEFEEICAVKMEKVRNQKLLAFQKKLGSLKFLDPACGSGNFLTESYLSLRRIENRVISMLHDSGGIGKSAIQVKISSFYGIEINDFAVTVAKTAMWIAECQMREETQKLTEQYDTNFFPLETAANIVEGNALRMDWATLQPLDETRGLRHLTGELDLFSGFDTELDGSAIHYDYIMGNPPFVGYSLQSDAQKKDILSIYVDEKGKPYKTAGKIDYVSGWYFKAAQLIHGTGAKCAFVSTNSITQGEQVASVWKPIFERFGIGFDFAYRTFRWDSESTEKAHVHCVIIGFSYLTSQPPLLEGEGEAQVFTSRNIKGDVQSAQILPSSSRQSEPQILPSPTRRGAGGEVKGEVIRHQKVSKEKLELARNFRKEPTESENAVWQMLRNRQIKGLKWRRQQVIDGFIADFYCAELKAVLEIDGSVHNSQAAQDYDEARTEIFSYHGIKTYRLKNEDCNLSALSALIETMILPSSSRQGEPQILPSPTRRGAGGEVESPYLCVRNERIHSYGESVSIATESPEAQGEHSHTIQDTPSYTTQGKPSYTTQGKPSYTIQGKPSYTTKRIFSADGSFVEASNINGYLLNADNVWIESRAKPICDVPQMTTGNRPADGGHLIIESSEYDEFIKKEPEAKKWIKNLTGAEEFINNKKRYCLWLVDASLAEIKGMKEVFKRVELCKEDRLKGAADRQKLADTPAVFRETKNYEHYLIVPRVSSEQRKYIPIGYLDSDTIPTDSALIIPNATLYHFGVLTSNVHMAWTRAVCGRLKSDYRYSKDIVYNNFPFVLPADGASKGLKPLAKAPQCTPEQAAKIEQTAQAILDARAKYPDSSLAKLYDDSDMPPELRKAHIENDKAVMAAYGFDIKMSETECVSALFALYEGLTKKA